MTPKFVAADTLISLPKTVNLSLFANPRIKDLEDELQQVRHDYFSVQNRQRKLVLQRKDKKIREELAHELMRPGLSEQDVDSEANLEASHKLAQWDPYDPQISADFFEPLWMFDQSLVNGFDVVIGNPPYQSAINHKNTKGVEYREKIKQLYESARGTWDLYIPFLRWH